VQFAQAKIGNTEELRQALAQEQQKVQTLTHDLRVSRQELDSVLRLLEQAREQWLSIAEAADGDTEKLQRSLQEERARGQRLEQELALTRRDLELQAALASGTGNESGNPNKAAERDLEELRKVAQQERDRASRLEQDLAIARGELERKSALVTKANADEIGAKETAERDVAELQKTFQQERDRAKRLEQDLVTIQTEVANQSSQLAEANEEMTQIGRSADNKVAKLRISLKDEHERAEALTQELSATRARLFAYEAQDRANDNKTKQLQELLREERGRSGRLEQELVTARRTVEMTAAARPSSEEAARTPPGWEPPWTMLLGSLQQPFRQSLRELAALPTKPKAPSAGLVVVTAGEIGRLPPFEAQTPNSVQPAADVGDTKLERGQAAELAWLTARATGLLGHGDIGAARAVLERAAELGSAQANFALAETYDPNILAKWGAYGTRSDAVRAREFYARAEANGIKEAKERFDALGR